MGNTSSSGISSSSKPPVLRLLRLFAVTGAVLGGSLFDSVIRRRTDFTSALAKRTRRAFERLGPTFVKAGQLMSSSAALLPEKWMKEMAHCCDEVPPTPWKVVSELLDSELGACSDEIVYMEQTPIAAGSMAQVYAARLANGEEVVVKVQRPHLEKVLAKDIRILKNVAKVAMRLSSKCAAANPHALVEGFSQGLSQQLSFRREAENAQSMRTSLSRIGVSVPKIYRHLSTDRVLVMQRMSGHRLDDAAEIDKAGIDRARLVTSIVGALMVPALGSGVFHGDMHPGNMVALPDGTLGLFDFGVVEELDPPTRVATAELFEALASRNYAEVVMAMFSMIEHADVDFGEMIPDIQAFVSRYIDRSLGAMDVREAIDGMLCLASSYDLPLPAPLVSFLKQVLYISGICQLLDPEFDVLEDISGSLVAAREAQQAAA